MFASPKNASCFFYIYIFLGEEYNTSRGHADVLIFNAPDDVFTLPQLSTVFGQDKTLKHPVNDCVLSDLCVWIVA